MAEHTYHRHHDHPGAQGTGHDSSDLADLLDLDAEVFGSGLEEIVEWAARLAPDPVNRVADVGAGTGTGSLALARRFPGAEMIAIDSSELMLDRLRSAAERHGVAGRLHPVLADLDVGWPGVDDLDVVWASASMHHVADPERVFRDIHAATNPGGVLVVVEITALPRFLPDDAGLGRPGLEERCHEALAEGPWNSYPDWRPHLERAGFQVAAERRFDLASVPAPPVAQRYARINLSRTRAHADGVLPPDDLDALDDLLAEGRLEALIGGHDVTFRTGRRAWTARRPAGPEPSHST